MNCWLPSASGSKDLLALSESDELWDLQDDDPDEHLGDAELDAGFAERYRMTSRRSSAPRRRLEAGTYGLSILSGEPIPDARLEALPRPS